MPIPVIGFAAWSGTGKTTLMEQIERILTERGFRVGVIKHDGHGFDLDRPGKDSYRHAQAGAETVVITSPEKTAVLERRGETLNGCIQKIGPADVILVEGFKNEPIPKIGISRKSTGKGLTGPADSFLALVTDDESIITDRPCFSFDEPENIAEFIMKEIQPMDSEDFTHFNSQGRARMVDVVNERTFSLIRSGGMKKGDVLTVAQIAGIMAAKHTPDWIPMCHPVPLNGIDLKLWLDESHLSVEIEATAQCDGKTGVEMEALTAVSGAALTVYDMCKAVQRDMVIDQIRLVSKTGGVHGDYFREESKHE